MADNNTIARPYAQAVFELVNASGDLATWSDALGIAGEFMADGQIKMFLSDPRFNDEQRFEFLAGLFDKAGAKVLGGKDKRGANFLKLLLENGRAGVLPEISSHFERLKAEVENVVEVTVTSASPISEKQKKEISKALHDRLGRDISIDTQIDENLIGGAVIRAGDVVIDGSLRSRLEGLANALTK